MTKKELIKAVCNRSEISQIDFEHGFNNLIEVVKETIANGEPIFIRGLGILKPIQRKSKKARDIGREKRLLFRHMFKLCSSQVMFSKLK
jgi:nucleoid DNA-binding protein